MAGAECSKVLECAVGKYERGKRENEKETRIRMKETRKLFMSLVKTCL